jgi:hypothetical protein
VLETLISSKTRIKLLFKFFLNSSKVSYLRSLESEFGESTNSIRVELNRLEKAGMLSSFTEGNKKYFQANKSHPLFGEMQSILHKHVGFDTIIENVINRLGDVKRVYVLGALASGMDSKTIELLIIGTIDMAYLGRLTERAEKLVKRKISPSVMAELDFEKMSTSELSAERLLIWEA